jgi:hypothetical protein
MSLKPFVDKTKLGLLNKAEHYIKKTFPSTPEEEG